jgi:hypothetical protein
MQKRHKQYRPYRAPHVEGMMRGYNRTVLGITGMGLVTNLGVGVLGSIPKV